MFLSAFSMKTILLLELKSGEGGPLWLMGIREVKAQAHVWVSLGSVGDILFQQPLQNPGKIFSTVHSWPYVLIRDQQAAKQFKEW